MRSVLTANRLVDGVVVFLDPHGCWSDRFADARGLADDGEEAEALARGQAAVAACAVVEPYLVALGEDGKPARLRERIRAEGPTVAYAGTED